MEQFKFESVKGDDGTYTIKAVPIFELGKHRDFDYSDEWAERAIGNFESLKRDREYRPTVILGHTRDDDEEKPAVGFLDNLVKKGKQLVADIVGVGEQAFEQIKSGAWPYRSVEVLPNAAQITALALLGGTPPYHKFAPLAQFGDKSGEWVTFGVPDKPKEPQVAEKTIEGGGDAKQVAPEKFEELQAELASEKAAREQAEADAKAKDEKYAEQFAELQEERRQDKMTALRSDLEKSSLAPAAVTLLDPLIERMSTDDTPVKFAEDGEEVKGLGVIREVVERFASLHKDGALFVDTGASGKVEQTSDPEESERFDDKIDKRAKEIVAERFSEDTDKRPWNARYRDAVGIALSESEGRA